MRLPRSPLPPIPTERHIWMAYPPPAPQRPKQPKQARKKLHKEGWRREVEGEGEVKILISVRRLPRCLQLFSLGVQSAAVQLRWLTATLSGGRCGQRSMDLNDIYLQVRLLCSHPAPPLNASWTGQGDGPGNNVRPFFPE